MAGRKVLLAVAGLVGAMVLLELCVRLLVPAPYWRFMHYTDLWQSHSLLGWENKPFLDAAYRMDQGDIVHFRTNADGVFPGPVRRQKRPGVLRIMLFGDSTVAGSGVPEDRRLNAHLERTLNRLGVQAEVINAGVDGYSTDQSLIRMRILLPLYHPDVAIYVFSVNDLGGNRLSGPDDRPKPVFVRMADGGHREIPPDFHRGHPKGSPLRAFLSRVWHGALLHIASYRLVQPALFRLRVRFGSWDTKLLLEPPTALYYSQEELRKADWDLLSALIEKMKDLSAGGEAHFLVSQHPALGETWPPFIETAIREAGISALSYDRFAIQNMLKSITGRLSISFCPVVERFQGQEHRGPFHLLPRDRHNNSIGYEIQAEALTDCVRSLS